jgi:plastocyanin
MRLHVLRPVILVAALAGCAKDQPVTPPARRHAGVAVNDNAFDPTEVTIRAGEDVTWVWQGNNQHGIQFLGSPTAAMPLSGNGTIYVRTFDTPGVYLYYCPNHGSATGLGVTGMSGRVTVE